MTGRQAPHHAHVKDMITAFAVGVLEADPYFVGYSPPPRFGEALRAFTKMVLIRWQVEDGVIPYFELSDLVSFFAFACGTSSYQPTPMDENHKLLLSIILEWNTPPSGDMREMRFVSCYDPTLEARDFIDISALTMNAVRYLKQRLADFDEQVQGVK